MRHLHFSFADKCSSRVFVFVGMWWSTSRVPCDRRVICFTRPPLDMDYTAVMSHKALRCLTSVNPLSCLQVCSRWHCHEMPTSHSHRCCLWVKMNVEHDNTSSHMHGRIWANVTMYPCHCYLVVWTYIPIIIITTTLMLIITLIIKASITTVTPIPPLITITTSICSLLVSMVVKMVLVMLLIIWRITWVA